MSITAVGNTNFAFAWLARTGARRQIEAAPAFSGERRHRQASSLSQSLDRLLNAVGGNLAALNSRREVVDQIKSQLTALRSSLQNAGRQGVSGGPSALREIAKELELSVERAVYGNVDVLETRPLYETRDVIATRDVYAWRDVYGTRDVYAWRDVYETRPVYEERDILATIVTGTRNLSGFSTIASAGIDTGADLSIRVGSNALATVKFTSSTRIAVTVNGSTTNFNFVSSGGAWRTGLLNALNSIADLSAQITSDGRLQLQTSNAQSLTIADVANGFLDFSGSPLAPLGLSAGTTQASVVGTEQVQVGTEEVVVGQEQYVAGQEQYVTGQEQYVAGQEEYVAGQEQVEVGTEQVVVGTEQVQTGTIQFSTGTRSITVGFDRTPGLGGSVRVDDLQARVEELALAVSALGSTTGPSGGAADGAQALAAQLSALLDSPDFAALASGAGHDALDRVIQELSDALSRASALDAEVADATTRFADAAQADLATLLLNSGLQPAPGDPTNLARLTAALLSGSPASLTGGQRMSVWA